MRVEWGGMSVELVCGLSAMEEAEAELGGLQLIFDNISGKKDLEKTVRALFRGMARCGYLARGEKPDMILIDAMDGWLSKESLLADRETFMRNRDAVLMCLKDGFEMQYEGKAGRKDKYTKAVEARMAAKEAKKKKQKLTVREFYSDALISGISLTEARTCTPAFVREMALRRSEHEIDINPLSHMGSGIKKNRGR